MPLTLAPGESIGHEASGRKLSVWLTNRRLVAEQSGLGKTALTSLPLEKMDHVLYAYTSKLRWLVIGVILSIVGLSVSVAQDDNRGAWAIAGGVIFVIIYFLTRRKRVVFATQACRISLEARGFGANTVEVLLTAVETARQARVNELTTSRPAYPTGDLEPLTSPPKVELVE